MADEQPEIFVSDPFGQPIPVLPREGEDMDQATKRTIDTITRSINQDPKALGDALAVQQIRRGSESGDPLDPEFRRAFLARQVDGPVVPGDIDDFLLRADLARSDLVTEKLAKLETAFPDSEFKFADDITGEPVILYRHPGEPVFREVESPELSLGDLGALTGGVLSEDVVGELLAFYRSRGTSLVGKAMRAAVGAAGGESAKSGIEKARGFEQSSQTAITERVVGTSGAAAIGVSVFDPIARVVNIIRGVRGLTVPTREGMETRAVAAREGLPPLLPGQLHPVFESIQQQAAGTSQRMQAAITDVSAQTVTRLEKLRDEFGDFRNIPDSALRKAIDREEREILSLVSNPKVTFAHAGRKVQKGLEDFHELLAEREGRLYKEAFDMSVPVKYDIMPAKQIGAMVNTRVVGKAQFKDIDLAVDVPLIPVNSPAFRSALRELRNLNPEIKLSPGNASPLEQVVRLRSTFFNLKDDPSLTGTEKVGSAIIHKALTQVMMHPRGQTGIKGRLRPTVARAWRQAASHTSARERFVGKSYARLVANSDTPSTIAKRLNLNNPDVVLGIRRQLVASGQRDKWLHVQNAFRSNLLNSPSSIAGKFERAENREALEALVPIREQRALEEISDRWAQLHSGPVSKMLRRTHAQSERALQLIGEGTKKELDDFITAVGGRDTAEGKALQAGIIENLLNKSTKLDRGKAILDKRAFLAGMADFRRRGILETVFDRSMLHRIDDYDKFVSFMPSAMGVGEGIQKAEIGAAAGAIALPTPGGVSKFLGSGLPGLTRNAIIAWAFTSPKISNVLTGKGKIFDVTGGESVHNKLVKLGGAIGVITDNMEEIARSGSFDISEGDIRDFQVF